MSLELKPYIDTLSDQIERWVDIAIENNHNIYTLWQL